MQNEKMQIIGGIFLMFSQGKITKEELDKAGMIESDLDMLKDKNKKKEYLTKSNIQMTFQSKTKTQINRF